MKEQIYTGLKNNKEHHTMYFTANVIAGIKSNKRARVVDVSCMEEIKTPLKALVGNSKRNRQLKETGGLYEEYY
jgi:hypothetical protein